MPENYTHNKNGAGTRSGMLCNTGYRRTYHKSDKISSSYFETETSKSKEDKSFLSVGVSVPAQVTNVEEWLLQMVHELGYGSWEELLPFLNLPDKAAVVVDAQIEGSVKLKMYMLGLVQQAVILSRCSHTGYDPSSPMIFSLKRINRTVTLVTVTLKSFYELD